MPGGERRKGWGDGIVNCKLGRGVSGEYVSHLGEDTGREVVANEFQL